MTGDVSSKFNINEVKEAFKGSSIANLLEKTCSMKAAVTAVVVTAIAATLITLLAVYLQQKPSLPENISILPEEVSNLPMDPEALKQMLGVDPNTITYQTSWNDAWMYGKETNAEVLSHINAADPNYHFMGIRDYINPDNPFLSVRNAWVDYAHCPQGDLVNWKVYDFYYENFLKALL